MNDELAGPRPDALAGAGRDAASATGVPQRRRTTVIA